MTLSGAPLPRAEGLTAPGGRGAGPAMLCPVTLEPAAPPSTASGWPTSSRATGPSRSASTASPTPPGRGGACSPASPTPATTPSPRSTAGYARPARPGRPLPARRPRRRREFAAARAPGATGRRWSSATTGARSPPTARPAARLDRWRRAGDHGGAPTDAMGMSLFTYQQPAAPGTFFFQHPLADGPWPWTTWPSSTGSGGTGPGLTPPTTCPRSRPSGRPGQPGCRPRHVPGDPRRRADVRGPGRRAGGDGRSRPSRRCTSTAMPTAAWASRWPRNGPGVRPRGATIRGRWPAQILPPPGAPRRGQRPGGPAFRHCLTDAFWGGHRY